MSLLCRASGSVATSDDSLELIFADLKALRLPSASPLRWRRFLESSERRLMQGEHLFGVSEANRLLAYGWLQPSMRRVGSDFGVEVALKEACSVLWDDFTDLSARGQGLQRRLIAARVAWMSQQGRDQWAVAGVLTTNTPSLLNYQRSEFRSFARLSVSTRFGIRTHVITAATDVEILI